MSTHDRSGSNGGRRGAVLCLASAALCLSLPLALTAAQPAGAATSATDLYHDALATTHAWSVHYVSESKAPKQTVLISGDAGPTAGSQQVLGGASTAQDTASIVVIGSISYLKGNAHALVDLEGMNAAQATAVAGQWIEFATGNKEFSQVVVGVRSNDVAQELEITGPYVLGKARHLDGVAVDAIEGTQKLDGHKGTHVVLYVRANGRHVPVEEDSVNSHGTATGTEHTTFSQWGEKVRPQAPTANVSVGPITAT